MAREKKDIELELNSCYLNQYSFAIIGTIFGTLVGARSKNYKPLVVGVTAGSIADLLYGRYYPCRELQEEYNLAKEASLIEKKSSRQVDR
jgi:hypothetical protein